MHSYRQSLLAAGNSASEAKDIYMWHRQHSLLSLPGLDHHGRDIWCISTTGQSPSGYPVYVNHLRVNHLQQGRRTLYRGVPNWRYTSSSSTLCHVHGLVVACRGPWRLAQRVPLEELQERYVIYDWSRAAASHIFRGLAACRRCRTACFGMVHGFVISQSRAFEHLSPSDFHVTFVKSFWLR